MLLRVLRVLELQLQQAVDVPGPGVIVGGCEPGACSIYVTVTVTVTDGIRFSFP